MVPSCNVTIRSPYIISPALDGPYMRGTSSQFVVTIVVCSSATYGRTFIQAIHRSRVAYAVLKRHIRPICVRVRIGGLIILYSHILLHSKTPGQWPKTTFLIDSKRKNTEDDNIARLLYLLPHLPSDSMRILISNIHCLLFQRSPKERTFASINLCACHLRIDATLFLCLHLPPPFQATIPFVRFVRTHKGENCIAPDPLSTSFLSSSSSSSSPHPPILSIPL